MNPKTNKFIALVAYILMFCTVLQGPAMAQEALGALSAAPSVTSVTSMDPKINVIQPASATDRLQALSTTRFHFMTLKQFQTSLFTRGEAEQSISKAEARLLNVGLNAFLISAKREELLLAALRQNKAVRIRFRVPEQAGNGYQVVNHPTKKLTYRLKPVVMQSEAVIEIRPLFNGSIAFQVTLEKGDERFEYDINWAGWISGFPWAR